MVRAIRHSPKSVAPTEKIPKANTICIASIDMWFPPLRKFTNNVINRMSYLLITPIGQAG